MNVCLDKELYMRQVENDIPVTNLLFSARRECTQIRARKFIAFTKRLPQV